MQLSLFDEVEVKPVVKDSWILVDGNNLLCRAYYATAQNMKRNDNGTPMNGVMTALKMLLNYQDSIASGSIVVFFDEGKGFRKALYPEYKEGRGETPEDLSIQFPIFREFLTSAEIPFFMDSELEADDLIASACRTFEGHKYVISNDKDLTQIISDDVTVVVRKGGNDVHYTPSLFEVENGFKPIQIIDVKALSGDDSDNIPGVKGIGEKGALQLIQKFGSVEAIQLPLPKELKKYEKKFDEQGIQDANFFKKLVTLVPTKNLQVIHYDMNTSSLRSKCEAYGMKSIVKLLD